MLKSRDRCLGKLVHASPQRTANEPEACSGCDVTD